MNYVASWHVCVAALFAAASFRGADAGELARESKHPVTLADLKTINSVEQLQVSPNGRMIAYRLEDHSEIFVVATRPNSTPRKLADGTFPVWSPDSRQLAYYSTASGTFQLWVISLDSGRSRRVTDLAGGIEPDAYTYGVGKHGWIYDPLRFSWSPDGSKLVFSSRVYPESAHDDTREQTGPLVLTDNTPASWTLAGVFVGGGRSRFINGRLEFSANNHSPVLDGVDQLFVANVRDGQTRQLTRGSAGCFTPSWSPDGQRIVCVSHEGRPFHGGQSAPTNLYLIDSQSGNATSLTQGSGFERVPSWSPDGRQIAYFGAREADPEREYIFVIPARGGTPVNVTSTLDREPALSFIGWSSDSRWVATNYKDGIDDPIARIEVPTGKVEVQVEPASATRTFADMSAQGTLAWSQSDPAGPAILRARKRDASSSYVVADLNPAVKTWSLGRQEVIRWVNSYGDAMEGILIEPPDYKAGVHYPVIVDPYPKLGNSFKGNPMHGNQAWASRGFVVFFPNGDGPHTWQNPWRSVRNSQEAKGRHGIDVAVDDVLTGVDELIRRGIVDPKRMCLYGFSNGGAAVNQVVTKTDRFKCAVSVAGAIGSDWSSLFFLTTDARFISDLAGVTPWDSPEEYVALSAVYRLRNVVTPMLLAAGDNDTGFLLGQIEMYNGLRYLGKSVTFLRYPNQGHGFAGDALEDFWGREMNFFERYLGEGIPVH